MKQCTKCQIYKNVSEFHVRNAASARLHAQCKDCYKEHRKNYSHQHYLTYQDAYKQRAKARNTRVRDAYHEYMELYLKDKACIDCGEPDPIVLELDHRDPSTKSFNVSKTARLYKNTTDLITELAKCDVVCSNCHKRRTAKQFNWYKGRKVI